MKLSMEMVREIKETEFDDPTIQNLCEDWLSLYTENEQLRAQPLYTQDCRMLLDGAIQGHEAAIREVEQLRQREAAYREASAKAIEMLQDMVDVANTCGSAYLYKRDTEKVTKLIEALSAPAPEYHNTEDAGNYRYSWKYTEEERPCGEYGKCYDCGSPYGTFPDMILPNELWELINPSTNKGSGLLCPTCIANRLDFINKWYETGMYMLKNSDFPYHNPEDVKALKMARKALKQVMTHMERVHKLMDEYVLLYTPHIKVGEVKAWEDAIAAIDALGVEE